MNRLTSLLIVLAALICFPSTAAAACPDADLLPAEPNLERMKAATLCLLNEERAKGGLAPLSHEGRLALAAEVHNKAMIAGRFFEHVGLDGSTVKDRIGATGYIDPTLHWVIGENLAWGTGQLGSPRLIVQAWMESPGHRANILKGAYSEIGIAIHMGVPVATSSLLGATYTTEFGHIDRPEVEAPVVHDELEELAAAAAASQAAPKPASRSAAAAKKKAAAKRKAALAKKRKAAARRRAAAKRRAAAARKRAAARARR